jgi:1-deoxy-D-xylulose-5-phosphate reductoisomerase
MKTIAILGSTGSIGRQTIDVIRKNGDISLAGISAAGHHLDELEKQAREFCPRLAAVYDEKAAAELRVRLADTDVKVLSGMDGMIALAEMPETDIFVTAIVGMIGIRPTMAAIRAGKDIALANKETLVTAGHLIIPLAKKHAVQILPVDSEHSAIFQCLQGNDRNRIHRLLITASGGPFRGMKREQLEHVTKRDALKHPNWNMGAKITIDSATLVNKGLEVMEARWLFGVSLDQIEVLVQPQSIIHSMVEFSDGAVMAQLGTPDMRLPIQYALYYPERRGVMGEWMDFSRITSICLEKPDTETFEGLPLAVRAARTGGSMPTVLNAANEEAVALFLADRIRFTDIYKIIRESMERFPAVPDPDLETILQIESDVRRSILERW